MKHFKCTLCVDGGPPAALKSDNRNFLLYANHFMQLKPKRFNRALFKDRVSGGSLHYGVNKR